ncbi:monocarboxylate transporter 13-like [Liolophura sinensis]|uniref:monocarboxylate transporter 13-like n=1 Tax=Liolophura sinensis TaxID=3198878 RepID=UPI0031580CE4
MSKASTLTSTDYSTLNLTDEQTTDVKESRRDTFPPDTGWAWVVAVASMMNVFLLMSFYRGLGILVVELMEIYEAPTAKVSLIFSCISIGFATSSLLFIFGIGDIFHERALVAASAFLTFLGFLVTFFSTRIEHVCVQGVCTGAAIQIGMTCGMSLVGRYFDKRLSVANGIVMSGSSLGVLVSPPVVQWLLNEYSYRGTALICAGLTLNSLACSSLMMPVPRIVKSEIVPVQQDSSRIMSATGCSESQDQSAENNPTKYIIVPEVPPRLGADKNTAIKDFSNVTYFVPEPDMEVVDISSTANTADDRRSARCFETVRLAIKQFS